jgi:hypothetical protein
MRLFEYSVKIILALMALGVTTSGIGHPVYQEPIVAEATKNNTETNQDEPIEINTEYHGMLPGEWENLTHAFNEFGIADLVHETLSHSQEAIDIAVFGTPSVKGATGSYMGTNEALLEVLRKDYNNLNNIVVTYQQGEKTIEIVWKDMIVGNKDFLNGKIDAPPGKIDPNWEQFGRATFVNTQWQIMLRVNKAYEDVFTYLETDPTVNERRQLLLMDQTGEFMDNPLMKARDILQRFDTYLFGGLMESNDFELYNAREALDELEKNHMLGG